MIAVTSLVNGLFYGALVALLATSFSWAYSTTRVFHIAQGAAYLCGGYAAALVGATYRWPLSGGVAAAVAASVVFTLILDRTVYRALDRREASDALRLVASLSVLIACSGVAALAFSPSGI